MEIKELFNENGNLKFDPYRVNDDDKTEVEKYNLLFDEDGMLKPGISEKIIVLITDYEWKWNCDAVALYHADIFADNTKGNYSTIYYFR